MSQTNLPPSDREFSVQPLVRSLTPFLVLPGASALVGVSYLLGAHWLANTAMGLPAGAWAVILATAGSKLAVDGRARARPLDDAPATARGRAPWWSSRSLLGSVLDVSGRCTAAAVRTIDRLLHTDYQFHLGAAHDAIPWPERPLRIGLRGQPALLRSLAETDGACPVEWFTISSSADPAEACRKHLLDAVVWSRADESALFTNVAPGAVASLYDWADDVPLSYASVFPLALDPHRVTLAPHGASFDGSPRIARAVVEAAAALSRRPGRLDLSDRLRGRRPDADAAEHSDLTPVDAPPRLADGALLNLARAVEHDARPNSPSHLERVGARIATAHLAAADLDEAVRLRLMTACARVCGDDPVCLLRLAAARIGALEDSAGLETLVRAYSAMRERPTGPSPDPFEFIQAELATGSGSSMSVGRVAAGICLLCAHAPAECIPYLRDDLMDDVRYAGWLIGADEDRRLLLEVFRLLERAQRSPSLELAPSRAA